MAEGFEFLRRYGYESTDQWLSDYWTAHKAKGAGKYPDEIDPCMRLRHQEMMQIKCELWHEGVQDITKRMLVEALNGERFLAQGLIDLLDKALRTRQIFIPWVDPGAGPAARPSWYKRIFRRG